MTSTEKKERLKEWHNDRKKCDNSSRKLDKALPLNWLPPRKSFLQLASRPKLVGITPVQTGQKVALTARNLHAYTSLDLKDMVSVGKFCRVSESDFGLPINLFWWSCSVFKFTRSPKVAGISPAYQRGKRSFSETSRCDCSTEMRKIDCRDQRVR